MGACVGCWLGSSVHGTRCVVLVGAGAQRVRPTLPQEGRLDLTVFPRMRRAEQLLLSQLATVRQDSFGLGLVLVLCSWVLALS